MDSNMNSRTDSTSVETVSVDNSHSGDYTARMSESTDCQDDPGDITAVTETADPPDGGWGWVVTFAGFMVQFLLDGVVCSFGLLLPELLDTFGSSVSLTSFAPAAYVAVFLVTGPAAALLVRRFGCRLVGFCGGLVASLGIVCSAYAPNIELFIFFYGAVAGLGVGLIYLPSITMASLYFDKKRGVVAGIITSGSGIGLLALAQLTEVLIMEFGWRGCNLITGGIVLNFCVCASLIRPLPFKTVKTRLLQDGRPNNSLIHHDIRSSRLVEDQLAADNVMPYDVIDESELDKARSNDIIRPDLISRLSIGDGCDLSFVSVEEIDGEKEKEADSHSHVIPRFKLSDSGLRVWSSIKHLFLGQNHLGGSHTHINERGGYSRVNHSNRLFSSTSHLPPAHHHPTSHRHLHSASSPHFNVFSTWLDMQVPPSLSHYSMDKSAVTWRHPANETRHHAKTLQFQAQNNLAQNRHFHSHTGISLGGLDKGHGAKPYKSISEKPEFVTYSQASPIRFASLGESEGENHMQPAEHEFPYVRNQRERSVSCGPAEDLDSIGPREEVGNRCVHSNGNIGNGYIQSTGDVSSLLKSVETSVKPEEMNGHAVNEDRAHILKNADKYSVLEDHAVSSTHPAAPSSVSSDKRSRGRCSAVCGWLVSERLLVLLLAGAFLIQVTSNVPPLLTPSYAYKHGVSKEQSAQILSIFGLMNTVGRLGSGLLVYWGCGSLRVHNVGTLMAGVACVVFPFCTTFHTIAACLAFVAVFLGAFPPLQPVILAEFLGAERLTSVFGTMCFVKAFANLAGAPLAGAVYGLTGVYTIPVAGCGALLILAALLHELVPCCMRSGECSVRPRDWCNKARD